MRMFNPDPKNIFPIYKNVHDIQEIRDQVNTIAREILNIIVVKKQKTIKDINKIFQATLSNYFFECYVCALIQKHIQTSESKKEIKERIELNLKPALSQKSNSLIDTQLTQLLISLDNDKYNGLNIQDQQTKPCYQKIEQKDESDRIPKYIQIIKVYSQEIKRLGIEQEYISMLLSCINEELEQKNMSKEKLERKNATLYQKKLCSLLILEYFLSTYQTIEYKKFNDLWNGVFLNFKINYFARERNIIQSKIHAIEQQQQLINQPASEIDQGLKVFSVVKPIEQKKPITEVGYYNMIQDQYNQPGLNEQLNIRIISNIPSLVVQSPKSQIKRYSVQGHISSLEEEAFEISLSSEFSIKGRKYQFSKQNEISGIEIEKHIAKRKKKFNNNKQLTQFSQIDSKSQQKDLEILINKIQSSQSQSQRTSYRKLKMVSYRKINYQKHSQNQDLINYLDIFSQYLQPNQEHAFVYQKYNNNQF